MGRRKAADSQSQSETQQHTLSQSQALPGSSQRARRQASPKNVTQQQQQAQTQVQAQMQTQMQVLGVEEEKEKGNSSIKWDGNRGMLLAHKLRDEYRTKWLCGTRINVAKQWAIDLGVSHLDPRGFRTKAAVAVMLKKYTQAKEVFLKSGSGDIMEQGIVDSKPSEVAVSLTAQCKRICKHWEILWGALGNINDDIAASGVGLNEAGMKGRLVIGGRQGEGGVADMDDDVTEDEDPSEVDTTTTTKATTTSAMSTRATMTRATTPSAMSTRATTTRATTTRASSGLGTPRLTASQSGSSIESSPPLFINSPNVINSPNAQQPDQFSNTDIVQSPAPVVKRSSIQVKRKAHARVLFSPSPLRDLDISLTDEDPESGGDSAYEDLEPEPFAVKPTPAKRAASGKGKRGDIAEVLFKDRSMGGVKKRKLSKIDEEMDLKMSIIKAQQKRLEIEELKYRSRTGEKSSEQRAHEIRLAELELKKERAKVEIEANRMKQLQFQWKLKQMGASSIMGDA